MHRISVGVLRGGPSSEYEVSLNSGQTVLSNLDQSKYEPRDIFITRDGTWSHGGREMPINKALQGVDVVFNALHGEYGEDGTVQRILDIHGMPYTGSGHFESALAINKQLTKHALKDLGIKMAPHLVFGLTETDTEMAAKDIFNSFPAPWVIKPLASGSSVGVSVAKDYHSLVDILNTAKYGNSEKVIVEQYIKGREATCGVTDNFRGQDIYAFFPVEIIPPGNVPIGLMKRSTMAHQKNCVQVILITIKREK